MHVAAYVVLESHILDINKQSLCAIIHMYFLFVELRVIRRTQQKIDHQSLSYVMPHMAIHLFDKPKWSLM